MRIRQNKPEVLEVMNRYNNDRPKTFIECSKII